MRSKLLLTRLVPEREEPVKKPLSRIVRWAAPVCFPGGILWALSPLGIHLSELKFKTPDVFWKLFPSAPLLLLVGLIGLYAYQSGRAGKWVKVGFIATLIGLVLVIAGDVGEFWLKVDDVYLTTAPAYRTFRVGLLLSAVGSLVFGLAAARSRAISIVGTLPFLIGMWAGLISFSKNLQHLGTGLWVAFGVAWAWLGLVVLVELVFFSWTSWRSKSSKKPAGGASLE